MIGCNNSYLIAKLSRASLCVCNTYMFGCLLQLNMYVCLTGHCWPLIGVRRPGSYQLVSPTDGFTCFICFESRCCLFAWIMLEPTSITITTKHRLCLISSTSCELDSFPDMRKSKERRTHLSKKTTPRTSS